MGGACPVSPPPPHTHTRQPPSWALSSQDRPFSSPIFTFLLLIGAVVLVVNIKSDAGAHDSGNADSPVPCLSSATASLMEVVSQQGTEIIKTVLQCLLRDAATLKGHTDRRTKAGTFCADFITCVGSLPAAGAAEAGPLAFTGGPGQAVPIPRGPGGRRGGLTFGENAASGFSAQVGSSGGLRT